MNRPLDSCWRALARTARFIGLRGKATAMAARNARVSVAAAPMAMGRNGSCPVSADHTPSYPVASARCAASAIPLGSKPIPPSIFMRSTVFPAPTTMHSLVLTAEEPLDIGGDLVAGGDGVDAHSIAFGGVEVLLQP